MQVFNFFINLLIDSYQYSLVTLTFIESGECFMADVQTNIDKFLKPQMQEVLNVEEVFIKSADSIIGNPITLSFVAIILAIFISVLLFPKLFGKYFSLSYYSIAFNVHLWVFLLLVKLSTN